MAALSILSLQACGGGGDEPSTTVRFRPDTASCRPGTWQLAMYIDGKHIGTESVSVGSTSTRHEARPGTRQIAAVELGTNTAFGPFSQEIGTGDDFTAVLICR